MIRVKLYHWVVALGLVLVYSSASNAFSDFRKAINDMASSSTHERGSGAEGSFSKISLVIPQNLDLSTAPRNLQSAPASVGATNQTELTNNAAYSPAFVEQLLSKVTPGEDSLITAAPEPEDPLRIVIPAIELDAPVVPAEVYLENVDGKDYLQWMVPNEFAAGWHMTSARLGEIGNTVFNGHHNVYGEVFRHLVDLNVGDLIVLYGDKNKYSYVITNKMIFSEKFQGAEVREDNAQWILPSQDERITLNTCWPYETNTHRLVIVAIPTMDEQLVRYSR